MKKQHLTNQVLSLSSHRDTAVSVDDQDMLRAYHLSVNPEGRDDGHLGHGHLCCVEEVVFQPLHLFQAVWGKLQQEVSHLREGRNDSLSGT